MCEFCGAGPICCVCGRGGEVVLMGDPATPENAGLRHVPGAAATAAALAERERRLAEELREVQAARARMETLAGADR